MWHGRICFCWSMWEANCFKPSHIWSQAVSSIFFSTSKYLSLNFVVFFFLVSFWGRKKENSPRQVFVVVVFVFCFFCGTILNQNFIQRRKSKTTGMAQWCTYLVTVGSRCCLNESAFRDFMLAYVVLWHNSDWHLKVWQTCWAKCMLNLWIYHCLKCSVLPTLKY